MTLTLSFIWTAEHRISSEKSSEMINLHRLSVSNSTERTHQIGHIEGMTHRLGILKSEPVGKKRMLRLTHHISLHCLGFSFWLVYGWSKTLPSWGLKKICSSILSCAEVWWRPPVLICCLKSRCLVRYYVGGWSRCGGCVLLYMFSRNGSSLCVCVCVCARFILSQSSSSSSLIITSSGPLRLHESPFMEQKQHYCFWTHACFNSIIFITY